MMIQHEIQSVATFIEAARKCLSGFGQTVHWFRGQASADWGLVPTVHRKYDRAGEHSLAAHFRLSAPTRHPRTPELTDLAGWICLMQHFGLPTRLLDWSTSPLVALYFALNSEPYSGAAAVWVLVPSNLNSVSHHCMNQTMVISGPEAQPLLEAALSGGPAVDEVLAVMGQDVDLRMAVQQGTFTLHGNDMALDKHPSAGSFLGKFIIPDEARKQLQEELWFLGVRRAGLFPDLSNLALDLASDERRIPPKASQRM